MATTQSLYESDPEQKSDPCVGTKTIQSTSQEGGGTWNKEHIDNMRAVAYAVLIAYMTVASIFFLKVLRFGHVECRLRRKISCQLFFSSLLLGTSDQMFIWTLLDAADCYMHDLYNLPVVCIGYYLLIFPVIGCVLSFSGIMWQNTLYERDRCVAAVRSVEYTAMWIGLKSIILAPLAVVYIIHKRIARTHHPAREAADTKDVHCVFVSKIYCKFWDPTHADNNTCPTCSCDFVLPDDAIVNVNPTEDNSKHVIPIGITHPSPDSKEEDEEQGEEDVVTSTTPEQAVPFPPHVKDTVVTPCGHTFHYYCLRMSLHRNSLCPICRTELAVVDCYFIANPTIDDKERIRDHRYELKEAIIRELDGTESSQWDISYV